VHAGLGAQQAVGVFAFDLDGGTLDASHIAWRFVLDTGLETFAFGVFQVLTQEHLGPVAGLGAASARLQVDKTIARVGWLVEHAPEFELLDLALDACSVFFQGDQAGLVIVGLAHLIEFEVVIDLASQALQHQHHIVEGFFFFAQFLGFLGVVPDCWVFE